jgi:hypothetical protein
METHISRLLLIAAAALPLGACMTAAEQQAQAQAIAADDAGLCQMPGEQVEPAGHITERSRPVHAAADVDDEPVGDAVVHAAAAIRFAPRTLHRLAARPG